MELKQMRYFLAVAQELNFGRAAERLHIAQPPLTRQIRAIEEDLGTDLFIRSSKGVSLTAAGQALLEEVPNILSLAQRAEDQARRAGAGQVGRLDVGIFGSGILNVIPLMLARFHAVRPQVQIGLHTMNKVEQIQALRERRITVGFNRLVPNEPDLICETLLRERMLVGLYDGHPLCAKAELTLHDMENEPMILYPNVPLPGLAQMVVGAFQREGVSLKIAQEVEDVLTCVALVAGGFGICITTESATNLRLPGVVYRALNSPNLRDIELSCIYRDDDLSPILHAFLEVARSIPERQPLPDLALTESSPHA